jgi:hypothetical protein
MQDTAERIGKFKVRRFKRGEQFLHAPATSAGEFVLYIEKNGTLIYIPLVEAA